jgi:hypothetical protein
MLRLKKFPRTKSSNVFILLGLFLCLVWFFFIEKCYFFGTNEVNSLLFNEELNKKHLEEIKQELLALKKENENYQLEIDNLRL